MIIPVTVLCIGMAIGFVVLCFTAMNSTRNTWDDKELRDLEIRLMRAYLDRNQERS